MEKCNVFSRIKKECQLHYFRAHKSIVNEKSLLSDSTTTIIKEELSNDEMVSKEFIAKYCKEDRYALIPIHPLQAEWLLHQAYIQDWIIQELLEYIGPVGKYYMATSSLRTLYHPNSKYMLKFSFPVKVTNSMRINKLKRT